MTLNHGKIVLASQSPRRAQLLREAGIAFEAVSPAYEEPDPHSWTGDAVRYVEMVSLKKAESVGERFPDRVILGADTTVALGGRMFGKPADEADARRILSSLSDTTHQAITGVALYAPSTQRRLVRHAVTLCRMRPMSPRDLDDYIRSGGWHDKAGAYGIQDKADAFVTIVEGSFSNVVGLPLELVVPMLAEFGVPEVGRG